MAPESAPRDAPGAGGHYFDSTPAVESRRSELDLNLPEGTFHLLSDRGVFSPNRIDPGTKALLVETSPSVGFEPELTSGDLVDVGAGYGPITVALAARYPERRIWAIEPNERARELCRINVEANCPGVSVNVIAPEDVPPNLSVAAMLSNPPIRIGKVALHGLLGEWMARLTPDGAAWLVVQRHLGADSLAKWLTSEGAEVQRLASRKGYRILEVRPALDDDMPD